LLLPSEIDITNGFIPPLAEKITLAFFWSIFTSFYFVINGIDGLATINSLSICLGLMVITVIGVWPVTYSFYTAIFIAIFLALSFFDRFPAKIRITKFQSQWIGFIIGWLGVLAAIEGSGSCFVILSMYYIYETIIAIGKKISFKKQYKTLANNTFYSRVANAGVPPQQICNLTSKINTILILLACLQIYSPNQQTLMIVAFFTVFWIILKITSPDSTNSHILLTSNLISMYKNTKKDKNTTTKDD
jgi:UDP-N-acetylmuramyl pentapeptide phosphotransferase/UDP-N-acetylglucosamine-1-phosphate transferase